MLVAYAKHSIVAAAIAPFAGYIACFPRFDSVPEVRVVVPPRPAAVAADPLPGSFVPVAGSRNSSSQVKYNQRCFHSNWTPPSR